ncbi:MAG: hypothetical protein LBJ00_04850 [Planctomycetaceae bacterium]|nr:hypothetical protein [Planctomycetaceae bacterium]
MKFNWLVVSRDNRYVKDKRDSTKNILYSSCFEIPEAGHTSVASRSGCSWAKPTAHTGYGINCDGCPKSSNRR